MKHETEVKLNKTNMIEIAQTSKNLGMCDTRQKKDKLSKEDILEKREKEIK